LAETSTATISVQCSCGKKLKAPASAVGKKAKCPKCGNVLTVKPPPPPPDEDNSLDALYDLAQESEQHAAQQQLAPRCPSCMREMAPGAVLCTNCGYDTRKGKAMAPQVAGAATGTAGAAAASGTKYDPTKAAAAALEYGTKGKKGVVDKMAPQGPFWKGLLCSGGGALIGAFVWVLIAWGTGYWGMLPVFLVALLAGVGMVWGQEGYSYTGGFTAMAITFVVTILARVAVVIAIVVPHMMTDQLKSAKQKEEERMPDLSQYDERVVNQLYMDQRKAQKPAAGAAAKPTPPPAAASADDEGDEDESDFESHVDKEEVALYKAVEAKLKAMPKTQYDAMVKKYDEEEKAARLQGLVSDDILKTVIGVHPSRASSVESDQADKAAKDKIAKMTQPQRDAEYKRLNAEHEKAMAEARAAAKKEREARAAARGRTVEEDESAARGAAAAIGAIVIFFLVFGSIRGAICLILALGLAYRTASGSISD
jgi:hypothetical protein